MVIQLALMVSVVCTFAFQVTIMRSWAPGDSHGLYFHCFVFIEAGGALVLGFWTLFRERSRARSIAARNVVASEDIETPRQRVTSRSSK